MTSAESFVLKPLTEAEGRQICTWKYEPPYDLYNWSSWEELERNNEEFADPEIRRAQYCSVYTISGRLAGFAQFFPMQGLTRLGLGMHPELCGQGLGVSFIKTIVTEAKKRAPSDQIDLEVLVWNDRAYKVYERAGFRYEQTYERMTPTGIDKFHCMVYRP